MHYIRLVVLGDSQVGKLNILMRGNQYEFLHKLLPIQARTCWYLLCWSINLFGFWCILQTYLFAYYSVNSYLKLALKFLANKKVGPTFENIKLSLGHGPWARMCTSMRISQEYSIYLERKLLGSIWTLENSKATSLYSPGICIFQMRIITGSSWFGRPDINFDSRIELPATIEPL